MISAEEAYKQATQQLQPQPGSWNTPAAKPVVNQAPQPATPMVNKPAAATPAPIKKTNQPVHGKFMSGNLLNKAFDLTVGIPTYVLAGIGKGVENKGTQLSNEAHKYNQTALQRFGPMGIAQGVWEGIKNVPNAIANRTQFGSEEGDFNIGKTTEKALKNTTGINVNNKMVEQGLNLGFSLATPSIPVGKVAKIFSPVAKVLKETPIAEKGIDLASHLGGAAMNTIKNTPKLASAVEKIPGLEYIRNPEAGKIITQANEAASTRISKLFNQVSDMAKGLTKDERINVGKIIEEGAQPTTAANAKLNIRANNIRQISDEIGKELVDLGVMSQESFDKYKGQYMSHIADAVKNEVAAGKSGKGALGFFLNSLKQRKNILGAEGMPDYIREFQFPVFKALAGEAQTAESVKGVQQLAQKFGTKLEDSAVSSIEKKIASGPRVTNEGKVILEDLLPTKIGRLFKNVAVPQEVADYVSRNYAKKSPELLEQIGNKALNLWKMGKTIYSGPAYHVRNLMSNQILTDMSTGMGLPRTLYNYGKAVKAYLGEGEPQMMQYLQELKDAGVINRMDIPKGAEELKPEVFGQGESFLKKLLNSPKKFQNASEETAKLNVFSFFRGKGMSIEDAANKAQEAIFSPYRISQAERNLVGKAFPFYSFQRQSLPLAIKTLLQTPERIGKYEKMKTAIEGLSPEGASNNKDMPENMKGQIRLPIKDKEGNYTYFDPAYIYPWGNFGLDQSKKLPFNIPNPLGLSINPIVQEGMDQAYNKDTYFDQPIAKSQIPERATTQRIQHGLQTFAPTMLPQDYLNILPIPKDIKNSITGIPSGESDMPYRTRQGSKLYSAFTNQPDYAGRTRGKAQSILDMLGLKSSIYRPADQAKTDMIDKKSKLKQINSERYSIIKNQSLSNKDKMNLLNRLNQRRMNIIMGN